MYRNKWITIFVALILFAAFFGDKIKIVNGRNVIEYIENEQAEQMTFIWYWKWNCFEL